MKFHQFYENLLKNYLSKPKKKSYFLLVGGIITTFLTITNPSPQSFKDFFPSEIDVPNAFLDKSSQFVIPKYSYITNRRKANWFVFSIYEIQWTHPDIDYLKHFYKKDIYTYYGFIGNFYLKEKSIELVRKSTFDDVQY